MNLPVEPEAKPTGKVSDVVMRFLYPSGSKPLAGYTIKRGIGSGGFGEVYYAVSDAGKEVALKLIRRHLDVELRGVRQCLNLKHPNLLAIHDIRTDDADDRWVVMEYIAGESLQQVIDRNPNGLPHSEVLQWMRGLASGVAYLHDHGIVHRDLKPGNIFCDEGIIKIGDYGLSKFVSCSRRSGQTESVGTVHYMAPEIANGRYGKEIDVYALGIMLYEMLTGRVPFEGESVGEVLMKHLTAEPDLNLLEPPFREICSRALAKDPEQRLTSAKEFLALLPAVNEAASPTPVYVASTLEPIVAAEVVPEPEVEEPIWKAVRGALRQLNEQWTAANFHPLIKAFVLVGTVFLLLSSAAVWFPTLFLLTAAYAVYRVVRAILLPTAKTRGDSSNAASVAAEAPVHDARRTRHWRREQRRALRARSTHERVAELTGSMLTSAAVASVLSIVMLVLYPQGMDLAQVAWLAIVGTLGAWAVMLPSKTWEGQWGEQAPRRFAMLAVGLVIGAMAWGMMEFLAVELTYETSASAGEAVMGPVRQHLPEGFYAVDGTPLLPAFLAYFGFLFLILRWWRQADPGRATRLSLWATGCCVFAAWVLNLFWPFPQPWGFMVAGIVAVAVQLASPWVSEQRNQPSGRYLKSSLSEQFPGDASRRD